VNRDTLLARSASTYATLTCAGPAQHRCDCAECAAYDAVSAVPFPINERRWQLAQILELDVTGRKRDIDFGMTDATWTIEHLIIARLDTRLGLHYFYVRAAQAGGDSLRVSEGNPRFERRWQLAQILELS